MISGVDSEELYKVILPMLTTVMLDGSASVRARAACAEALGVCTFIGASEIEVFICKHICGYVIYCLVFNSKGYSRINQFPTQPLV